ncbi:MAG: glycosyltransferase [Sandaracinaceae bacterium]
MSEGEILYVTFDGLGSPLGYSQVVRPVSGLAARGFRYRILSLERERDLADPDRLAKVRAHLDAAGVAWETLPYRASRTANVRAVVRRLLTGPRPRLVHARSYLSALAALTLRTARGVPYLFDTRGYWVDERLDGNAWFTSEAALSLGRSVERRLYRNAAAVVMLTEVAASDVRHHLFGRHTGVPVRCIPTLTDYEDFAFRFDGAPVPDEAAALRDRLVLGHVGAINHAYRIEEMLTMARGVMQRRDDAHFLCLTRQEDEMRALLSGAGIDVGRATVRSVSHAEIPGWLRVMDWAFVLREDSFANRAAMPTKLGELFATGVHPVAWGGNDDVRRWVQRAGTGRLLVDLDDASLEDTVADVATRAIDASPLRVARERSEPHFGLRGGVDAYAALLSEIAG